MSPLRTLRDGLGDESLRVAILVGLATVPFTVAFSWESVTDEVVVLGGSISGGALLLAGLLVGYYYHGRQTEARRAGVWTGLAGSIGAIVVFGANSVATIATASWPWTAAAAVATPFTVAFGVGLTVLATALPAMGIDWVLTRLDRDRRVREPDSSDDANESDPTSSAGGISKWWVVIATYAILAPIALVYALWVQPESDAGVLLAMLLLLPVILLSAVALVALFVDATEPRKPSEWLPRVRLYVGGPIAASGLVYLVALARGTDFPPGYGQYGYIAALWLAATAYLVNRRRHRASGRRRVGAT